MKVFMDIVQLYIGSEINFWELPFEAYGFLVPLGWMKHTWEALSTSPLVLHGPSLSPPLQRQHHKYLMDAFVDQFTNQTLLMQLNACRLYLHATTLADISSADGLNVDLGVWLGQRSHNHCHVESEWIRTRDTGPTAWQTWQDVLQQIFLFPDAVHLRLQQPLGLWHAVSDIKWKWWLHPPSCQLFCHKDNSTWSRSTYRRPLGPRYLYSIDTPIPPDRVPSDLL